MPGVPRTCMHFAHNCPGMRESRLAGSDRLAWRHLLPLISMPYITVRRHDPMTALVLDCMALAQKFEAEMRERVAALRERAGGRTPILATILVGADPASATYVKMKGNACERVGMASLKVELPETTTTAELLAQIETLNRNPDVHG